MKLTAEDYEFDFPTAIEAYKFDETDNLSPYFHGVTCLKAVDVMVELPDSYLFIEIKTYQNFEKLKRQAKKYDEQNIRTELRNNLLGKYRDTFIYRYCEKKIDKAIYYICLMNFPDPLKVYYQGELRKHIPTGFANKTRWKRPILHRDHLFVVDEAAWNRTLSGWGTCVKLP